MLAVLLWLLAAPEPLTLDAALEQARAANARKAVAAMEVRASEQQLRSARAELLPSLELDARIDAAPRNFSYNPANPGEDQLQVSARQPLYAGGALHARIAGAEAQLR